MNLRRYVDMPARPIVGLIVTVLLLLGSTLVRGESPTQASTVDELIKMFDSSSCKECHEKIYEQWEKSHHARPLIGMNDMMLLTQYLKRVNRPDKPADQAYQEGFPVFQVPFPPDKIRNRCSGGRNRQSYAEWVTSPR